MATSTRGAATDASSRRLEELLDREEIRECLLRYCRGVDRRDPELARSAYHEDARDDHIAYVGPGHGLVDWADGYMAEIYERWQHFVTNTTIELDGDTAHVETYYFMIALGKGSSEIAYHSGGRYIDRFERRDGRWGIAARVLTVEWATDAEITEQFSPLGVPFSMDRSDPSYDRPLRADREDRVIVGPGSDSQGSG